MSIREQLSITQFIRSSRRHFICYFLVLHMNFLWSFMIFYYELASTVSLLLIYILFIYRAHIDSSFVTEAVTLSKYMLLLLLLLFNVSPLLKRYSESWHDPTVRDRWSIAIHIWRDSREPTIMTYRNHTNKQTNKQMCLSENGWFLPFTVKSDFN